MTKLSCWIKWLLELLPIILLIKECKWIVVLLFVITKYILCISKLILGLEIAEVIGLIVITEGLLLILSKSLLIYCWILLSKCLLIYWLIIHELLLLIEIWLLSVRKWEGSILLLLILKVLVWKNWGFSV